MPDNSTPNLQETATDASDIIIKNILIPDDVFAEIAIRCNPLDALALGSTNKNLTRAVKDNPAIWRAFHRKLTLTIASENEEYSYKKYFTAQRNFFVKKRIRRIFKTRQETKPLISFEQKHAETAINELANYLASTITQVAGNLIQSIPDGNKVIHKDDYARFFTATENIIFMGKHRTVAETKLGSGPHYRLRSPEEMKLFLAQLLVETYSIFESVTIKKPLSESCTLKIILIPYAPNLSYSSQLEVGDVTENLTPTFHENRYYINTSPWMHLHISTLEEQHIYPDFTAEQFHYFASFNPFAKYFDHYFKTAEMNEALQLALHIRKFALAKLMLTCPTKSWVDNTDGDFQVTIAIRDIHTGIRFEEFSVKRKQTESLRSANSHLYTAVEKTAPRSLIQLLIECGAKFHTCAHRELAYSITVTHDDPYTYYVQRLFYEDSLKIVKTILDAKVQQSEHYDNGYILIEAIEHRYWDIAATILCSPLDINWSRDGNNILHIAAQKNAPAAIIQGIIYRGINLSYKNNDGHTAEYYATSESVLYIIQAKGVYDEKTAYHLINDAFYYGTYEIAKLLLTINTHLSDDYKNRLFASSIKEKNLIECAALCITKTTNFDLVAAPNVFPLLKHVLKQLQANVTYSHAELAAAIKAISVCAQNKFPAQPFNTHILNTRFFASWCREKEKVQRITHALENTLLTLFTEYDFTITPLQAVEFGIKLILLLEKAEDFNAKQLEIKMRELASEYTDAIPDVVSSFTKGFVGRFFGSKVEITEAAGEAPKLRR